MEFDRLEGEINGDTVGTCLSSIINDSTVESHRYYLARRTMLEMLRDRGFIIPSTEIDLSLQDFRDKFGPKPDPEKLRISTSLRSDNEKKPARAIYASQTLHFKLPAYVGEEMLGEVVATNIRQIKNEYIMKFSTRCFKNKGLVVLDGEASAILPTLSME